MFMGGTDVHIKSFKNSYYVLIKRNSVLMICNTESTRNKMYRFFSAFQWFGIFLLVVAVSPSLILPFKWLTGLKIYGHQLANFFLY